jgi:hypothetical protein
MRKKIPTAVRIAAAALFQRRRFRLPRLISPPARRQQDVLRSSKSVVDFLAFPPLSGCSQQHLPLKRHIRRVLNSPGEAIAVLEHDVQRGELPPRARSKVRKSGLAGFAETMKSMWPSAGQPANDCLVEYTLVAGAISLRKQHFNHSKIGRDPLVYPQNRTVLRRREVFP